MFAYVLKSYTLMNSALFITLITQDFATNFPTYHVSGKSQGKVWEF